MSSPASTEFDYATPINGSTAVQPGYLVRQAPITCDAVKNIADIADMADMANRIYGWRLKVKSDEVFSFANDLVTPQEGGQSSAVPGGDASNFLEKLQAKLKLAGCAELPPPVYVAIIFILSFLACFSIGLATGIPVLAVGTFNVLTPLSLFAVNKLVSNKPRHSREPAQAPH